MIIIYIFYFILAIFLLFAFLIVIDVSCPKCNSWDVTKGVRVYPDREPSYQIYFCNKCDCRFRKYFKSHEKEIDF